MVVYLTVPQGMLADLDLKVVALGWVRVAGMQEVAKASLALLLV
jgi:hypothetical protein